MFRGAYGGRGSGKSYSFALMAAVWGYAERLRILCTRDLQVSIKESFHAEVKLAIQSTPWLAANYDVGVDYIRGHNGTEFLFRGLRHNTSSVKSMAQIDLCIVEEAEDVQESSWLELLPTIRAPKSEVWVVWNPREEDSATDKRFKKNPPPQSAIVELNFQDNPEFPDRLDMQRQYDQQTMDDGTYAHVWLGRYLQQSDAQIMKGKYAVDVFEPSINWDGPYFGADWGFSKDPTTLVKSWIYGRTLYIEYEAWGLHVDIDAIPSLFDTVPGSRSHVIRADSARPETISHVNKRGFNIHHAVKGPNSVEDGIAYLRSFEKIVIHPRCARTVQEFRTYSYKVDRLSGDVLPVVVDANNHCMDALRYSLEPMMGGRQIKKQPAESKRRSNYEPSPGGWMG